MSILSHIPSFLKNKFFLATTGFVVWMLFFDRNDFFTQWERKNDLKEMKASKAYFTKQIAENREISNSLQFNASAIEKFARETYLMKKENEDLFLIQPLEQK
ncbi:MAG: FtsB family cell division protein [Flavisolibacter sp.]